MAGSSPIVVLDACVLYPAQVRSLFLYLAGADLIQPRWSDTIHAEWMRTLLREHPDITQSQVERIRDLMNAHVPECLVENYEELVPKLDLPDPDDRHVLAAAIAGEAEAIITFNLADFPAHQLLRYDIRLQHPDEFVEQLLETNPIDTIAAIARHRASLKWPAKTVDEFLAILNRGGLLQTCEKLNSMSKLL